MYTLYGFPGSGSAAIEAALELTGQPYRLVEAASWQPGAALDELRRVNPLAQIPTLLLPDGRVLTESAAILIHLGLAHPEAGLLPTDPGARAQTLRGLVFIAANCYAAISVGDYPDRWGGGDDAGRQEQVRQAARAQLHAHWSVFADQFPATPFLGGAALGALDLLAVVVSQWSGARAHLRQQRPAFFSTLQHIEAQPVLASVLARHRPAS